MEWPTETAGSHWWKRSIYVFDVIKLVQTFIKIIIEYIEWNTLSEFLCIPAVYLSSLGGLHLCL